MTMNDNILRNHDNRKETHETIQVHKNWTTARRSEAGKWEWVWLESGKELWCQGVLCIFSTILHCTVEQLEHNNTFCPHCPQQAVGCAVVPSSAPYISFLFWAALSGTMLFSPRWFVTWVRTFTLWKGVVLWPQDLVLYSWLRLSTRVWGRAGR